MAVADSLNLGLKGKTALVCGASQGIGAATAIALADLGARVVALARSESGVASMTKSLSGNGHLPFPADLSDLDSLDTKLNALVEKTGPIEILICNAGGPPGGPLAQAKDSDFLAAFAPHLYANIHLIRHIIPGMRERRFGRIINIISTSVKAPIPNLGVSNTVRAAVASWGKTLAAELGPDGITVNSVLPGFTRTGRLETLLAAAAAKTGRTVKDIEQEWLATVPARRFAEPKEVAALVAFLATPAAAYINGVAIPVDGGRTPNL